MINLFCKPWRYNSNWKTKSLKSFSFGVNRGDADVSITSIKANPFVEIHYSNITILSHLIGLYNASNLYAAIIGKYFEVEDLSKEALESYIPENNRSQLLTKVKWYYSGCL
jgi:UDP-N-acetylmuramoyl-tripeptide--D-alanyl-D-alanine ligase